VKHGTDQERVVARFYLDGLIFEVEAEIFELENDRHQDVGPAQLGAEEFGRCGHDHLVSLKLSFLKETELLV